MRSERRFRRLLDAAGEIRDRLHGICGVVVLSPEAVTVRVLPLPTPDVDLIRVVVRDVSASHGVTVELKVQDANE